MPNRSRKVLNFEGTDMEFSGYGVDVRLAEDALIVTAKNFASKGALGATERTIPLDRIVALSFKPASLLGNGRITIQSDVGVTLIHFVRRSDAAASKIYDTLTARTITKPGTPPRGPLANERLQARRDTEDDRPDHRSQVGWSSSDRDPWPDGAE